MAQAQLDARNRQNTFYFDLNGQLTVKIWKRRREGIFVTIMKPGTTQSLTFPMDVLRSLFEAQDIVLLASDFIQGLVGVSPHDFNNTDQC